MKPDPRHHGFGQEQALPLGEGISAFLRLEVAGKPMGVEADHSFHWLAGSTTTGRG